MTILRDAFGRLAQPETLELTIPVPPPPGQYSSETFENEKSFPVAFPTAEVLPADSPHMFWCLYDGDLTGLAWTSSRWHDAATASWLSREQDGTASAFGEGMPHELVDHVSQASLSLTLETVDDRKGLVVSKESPFYVGGQRSRRLMEFSASACATTAEGREAGTAFTGPLGRDVVLSILEIEDATRPSPGRTGARVQRPAPLRCQSRECGSRGAGARVWRF